MEWPKFHRVSGESSLETLRKLCLSAKFIHQEIRWNYGISHSDMCTFKSKHLNEVHKINKKYNCNSKMAVYLIEWEICGEQYTGSTKTKFRSRANNYKSTQRKFVNKEAVPKQALKQKRFHEHYCSDRHNGIEDWVITLIDSADTLKELRKKEL